MNQETKALLKRTINHFLSVSEQDKDACVQLVEKNISAHYEGLKSIGFGYQKDFVTAGEIFLRIFKTKD